MWEYLKQWLTPQTVTTITTVVMFLVALLRLLSSVKTLNKQKVMTLENVRKDLLGALQSQNALELQKAIEQVTMPIAEAVVKIKPYLDTFTKVLALSQENTPQSRLAILELLSQMGKQEIVVNAIQVVQQEIKQEEEKQENLVTELKEVIEKPVE